MQYIHKIPTQDRNMIIGNVAMKAPITNISIWTSVTELRAYIGNHIGYDILTDPKKPINL